MSQIELHGTTNSAYDKLSSKFDALWLFSDEYKSWMERCVQEVLELNCDSLFADIGGGTGTLTSSVAMKAGIPKALCVEPSTEMLNQARKYPNLILKNLTAENFAKNSAGWNRILIKEAVHHINDRCTFWKDLRKGNPEARVLVVTRPCRPGFLLFQQAYQKFAQNQPSLEVLLNEVCSSGYKVNVMKKSWPVEMKKKDWYFMLQSRFISDLAYMTDEEIRNGILEIELNHSATEKIKFNDELIFILLN